MSITMASLPIIVKNELFCVYKKISFKKGAFTIFCEGN